MFLYHGGLFQRSAQLPLAFQAILMSAFFLYEALRHAETHNTWEREAANLPTA